MSIDPKEAPGKYAIGLLTNNWGEQLNNNMADLDERLAALETPAKVEETHETLGIVAGAATVAAIGMSSAKPVSRRGMFNFLRSKNATR